MTATQATLQRPGAAPSTDWSDAVVRGFDVPAAVLELSSGRLVWSSAAFHAVAGGPHAGLRELDVQLPGIANAIDDLLRHAATSRTVTLQAGTRAVEVGLRHADGEHVLLRLSDLTREAQARQRHLEDREQLLFTSRALSLGEMATTLAHEINQPVGTAANLLRGVVMRLQRERAAMQPDDRSLTHALQGALDQVMFVAKVIARIREYTHLHTPTLKLLQPEQVVQACAALLDWEIERAGVRVVRAFSPEALWVRADELMLQQVLVNLMRNAIDAMRANARDQRELRLTVRRDGPQVELIVRDNGSGISEQAAETLFTPFVSSKPTGTGIGLNICRSFIELHHGRLWFSRNEDRGISFHAALPLTLPPPEAITP